MSTPGTDFDSVRHDRSFFELLIFACLDVVSFLCRDVQYLYFVMSCCLEYGGHILRVFSFTSH